MDGKKWHFRSNDNGLTRKLQEGITTHVFFGKNIMLSLVEIAPHTTSTVHSHPEEQWGTCSRATASVFRAGKRSP